MTRRTPARLLAPLALVAVAVALIAVVSGGSLGGAGSSGAPTSAEQANPQATPAAGEPTPRTRRTYTVRPGDTPSGIAEKTGVPVERLLELNPDVDAQSLQTGAKLKLR